MTMPTSIRLIGQTFTVERVSRDHGALVRDGGKVGTLSMGKQTIYVADDLAPDQERDTLVHELLHALMGIVGMYAAAKEEERVVGTLTPLLLDAVRGNPEMVGYLTEVAA